MTGDPLPPRVLLVEASGRVRASSASAVEQASTVGRSCAEVLGVDWDTLAATARSSRVLKLGTLRMQLEPLFDGKGALVAVVVLSPAVRHATSTLPPPSSSRFGRDLAALVGKDTGARSAVDLALRLGRTMLPVLVVGEPGTGADVLARSIHAQGARSAGPFVHVRASTLPADEVDAVLFGLAPHPAAGGTLFVEDIHELSLEAGRRLAHELDRGLLADTLLIASAPPDVRDRAARGAIARELFTLVRGSLVSLPALREREDLAHLVKVALADRGAGQVEISTEALQAMTAYGWPGNLQELWGVVEHALLMAGATRRIGCEHLPLGVLEGGSGAGPEGLRRAAERTAVEEALRGAGGNLSLAAKRLGVARSTLYRMLERHGFAK